MRPADRHNEVLPVVTGDSMCGNSVQPCVCDHSNGGGCILRGYNGIRDIGPVRAVLIHFVDFLDVMPACRMNHCFDRNARRDM